MFELIIASVKLILLVGGLFLFLGIVLAKSASSGKETGTGSSNNSGIKQRMKLNYTCPYCGYSGQTYKDPANGDSGYHFRCNECRREFGDVSKMTAAEKRSMEAINQECNQIDNMPELGDVVKCVIECMKNTGTKGRMITFKENGNGMKIEYLAGFNAYGKPGMPEMKVLTTLRKVYSQAGVLHISLHCIECYKKQLSPEVRQFVTFQLMDSGFSWDWKLH